MKNKILKTGLLVTFASGALLSSNKSDTVIGNNNKTYKDATQRKEKKEVKTDNYLYASHKATRAEVQETLNKALSMYSRNARSLSKRDVEGMVDILHYANNSEHFKINYKLVVAIISHESKMFRYARNHNRRKVNGKWATVSIDYGIGQNNSRYIDQRFRESIAANNKYRMTDVAITTNKYDPVTGVIATVLYLKEVRTGIVRYYTGQKKPIDQRKMIIAYNAGLQSTLNNVRSESFRARYYREIVKHMALF